jgi:RHS repeat-associated protein
MPERTWTSDSVSYRYGFNTQEKDDEIYGVGNSYTAEFWQYDSRLGRRWNVDPVVIHSESSYATFRNNPIYLIDPNGDEPEPITGGKSDRSVRKYQRKFDRMTRRDTRRGSTDTDQDRHNRMEDRYNDKRWMWIKDSRDGQGGGEKTYFHAGDLYKYRNRDQSIPSTIQVPGSNGDGIVGTGASLTGQTFQLPAGATSVTFTFSATDSRTWSYTVYQGDQLNPTSLAGATLILPQTSVTPGSTQTITIDLNTTLGTVLYVVFPLPSGTGSSTGGTGITPTVVFTVPNPAIIPKPKPHNLASAAGTNYHRLNRATRTALQSRREKLRERGIINN